MKEVLMIRHGKSTWDYAVDDRDRPLQERGIRDGHHMARALKSGFRSPDAIFSSPANRALHTCMILMQGLGIPTDQVRIVPDLYDFGGDSVRAFVHSLENRLQRILLFGHNHAFTELANRWGDRYIENVPTSGFVHLEFPGDSWSALGKGRTLAAVFPKDLA